MKDTEVLSDFVRRRSMICPSSKVDWYRDFTPPFSIMLALFSAFFGKKSNFFSFFLEKELLAFSVIFCDCDPDFSTQKDN